MINTSKKPNYISRWKCQNKQEFTLRSVFNDISKQVINLFLFQT